MIYISLHTNNRLNHYKFISSPWAYFAANKSSCETCNFTLRLYSQSSYTCATTFQGKGIQPKLTSWDSVNTCIEIQNGESTTPQLGKHKKQSRFTNIIRMQELDMFQ